MCDVSLGIEALVCLCDIDDVGDFHFCLRYSWEGLASV